MKRIFILTPILLLFVTSSYAQKWESIGFNSDFGVYSLLGTANGLYAGEPNGIQLWNGTNWTNLGEPSAGAFPLVLTEHNNAVYMGSDYWNLSKRWAVCKYTANGWARTGGEFSDSQSGVGVSTMLSFNGELVIGGYLGSYNGGPFMSVARFDGTTWHAMGKDVHVRKLVEHNGELYAFGNIARIKRVDHPLADSIIYCAGKWNGTQWIPLDSSFYKETMTGVSFNGNLVTTWVDHSLQRSVVAKWTGSSFVPIGGPEIGSVEGFKVFKNELYVFGTAVLPPNSTYSHVVMKLSGSNWTLVGSPFNFGVLCLEEYNGHLFAGGYFSKAGNDSIKHLAKLNLQPMGIQEQSAPAMQVYPNPAKGDFTLETSETGMLHIHNHLGQVVGNYSIEQNSTRIKTDHLKPGIYVLYLETDKGRSGVKLVIN
jgi:hypothetical protein